MNEAWHRLRLQGPAEALEAAAALLWTEAVTGLEEESGGIAIYATRPWSVEAVAAALSALPDALRAGLRPQRDTVPDRDWMEAWKAGWKPTDLGERITVLPAWWSEPTDTARGVVRIDPGRAFGTGTHITTRLAWAVLERTLLAEPPRRMIDVGTGTGLLSLAAAHLAPGVLRVGTELDSQAVPSLAANLPRNPELARGFLPVRARTLPVADASQDLVVANLTAAEQRQVAPGIDRVLAPGGRLVLSGYLDAQWPEAVTSCKKRGYKLITELGGEGWTAGLWRLSGIPQFS